MKAQIPNSLNGVFIDFASSVNRNVDDAIVKALRLVLKPNIAAGHRLDRIYVSSANDSHTFPSRHVQGDGKGIDISRINRKRMSVHYGTDAEVTAITNALQVALDAVPSARENFGPHFKRKLGQPHNVPGHGDHIHFSVN